MIKRIKLEFKICLPDILDTISKDQWEKIFRNHLTEEFSPSVVHVCEVTTDGQDEQA